MTSVQKWKPWQVGDVAVVPSFGRVMACGDGLWSGTSTPWRDLGDGRVPFPTIRPLVVIDPEDREQVERLAAIYCDPTVNSGVASIPELAANRLQAALRQFASPTPRIEEPKTFGAMCEGDDGYIFVRQCSGSDEQDMTEPWLLIASTRFALPPRADRERKWADIAAVRILSPGVEVSDQ